MYEIKQTVEIPANHRLIIDVPREIPAGPVIVTFTPAETKASKKQSFDCTKGQFTKADDFDVSFEDSRDYKDSAFGCFHHFADPAKIHDEKNAWSQAIIEKYAKN